jgi:hypothetical protein
VPSTRRSLRSPTVTRASPRWPVASGRMPCPPT